jgi:hypothetical protein
MRKIVIFCLVIFGSSCTLKEQEKPSAPSYFDLERYFKAEAKRLAKASPQITKSVEVNGQVEQKILKISTWEKEFDSFISAGINKASWKGSFKIQKSSNLEIYLTENKKIPVKKLEIIYRNDKVYGIKIFITNTNSLYTSKDSLSYYPDSLYQINKTQQIKLMDEKKYIVTGRFK